MRLWANKTQNERKTSLLPHLGMKRNASKQRGVHWDCFFRIWLLFHLNAAFLRSFNLHSSKLRCDAKQKKPDSSRGWCILEQKSQTTETWSVDHMKVKKKCRSRKACQNHSHINPKRVHTLKYTSWNVYAVIKTRKVFSLMLRLFMQNSLSDRSEDGSFTEAWTEQTRGVKAVVNHQKTEPMVNQSISNT